MSVFQIFPLNDGRYQALLAEAIGKIDESICQGNQAKYFWLQQNRQDKESPY